MSILESHKTHQPRLIFFHYVVAAMIVVLATGLAYRQLLHTEIYSEREKVQNQRRVLVPGPRGNIYDREGKLLVGNRARFAVVVYLAELVREFRSEELQIVRNFRALEDASPPSREQIAQLARSSVVQRYLDEVNRLSGRSERVDSRGLERHYHQRRLLPFVLVEDLAPEEFARVLERLPVNSPLQLYTSSTRHYPYGSAAAHTLGYVGGNLEVSDANLPGEDLMTFAIRGTSGRNGLELRFDSELQGETGGIIYRVFPDGNKVDPPVQKQLPVQGRNLRTSLDIDLQLALESAMQGRRGSAVVLDVQTGEVLAITSKPDYDLNDFSPSLSHARHARIQEDGAWENLALRGAYPPGSTFKIISAIAGLRAGVIKPGTRVHCPGYYMVGRRRFPCHQRAGHGSTDLLAAIRQSCNVYFYQTGLEMGARALADESRRFHLDERTGIELPSELSNMVVPDPDWKRHRMLGGWVPGDTANLAIGQGFLLLTPLQMASFVASFARGETLTRPTLLYQPERRAADLPGNQPLGLSASDYALVVQGMELAVTDGTARTAHIPGIRIAGKTGTAQATDRGISIELAVFAGFAPVEAPTIAVFVLLVGTEADHSFAGGRFAGPVAKAVLEKYFEKRGRLPAGPRRL